MLSLQADVKPNKNLQKLQYLRNFLFFRVSLRAKPKGNSTGGFGVTSSQATRSTHGEARTIPSFHSVMSTKCSKLSLQDGDFPASYVCENRRVVY